MAATKAYDPKFAEPGNEAFRRYVSIEYKPGNIRVTHVHARGAAKDDDEDVDTPFWLAPGKGFGPSGAPLPPAPAPGQTLAPDSNAETDGNADTGINADTVAERPPVPDKRRRRRA